LLQKFLNTYESQNLTVDGVYSKETEKAVIAWQEKYAKDVLKPWGLKKGTGYVYTASLKKMKQIQQASCKETRKPVEGGKIFKRTLKMGDKGEDVKQLQIFLNNNGFPVALSGAGSAGKETNLFGKGLKQALAKFQEAHADELLKPFGLKKGNGVFGEATLRLISKNK
jgi:peptidoglycan hydrolase-like protein with peptidoglycan-binding domain